MTFDDIRRLYPSFGVTLYAVVPGEHVTLELITKDKDVFYFTGATAEDALDAAFPPEPPPDNVFD